MLVSLLLISSIFSLHADLYTLAQPGTVYDVNWPAIHLEGTFTMNVNSSFGTYYSTSALGSYGGTDGQYNTTWTSVELSAQPTRVDLTFHWDKGYTGFGYNADAASPWATAQDAWDALIARGAQDGVMITAVPEPSALFPGCVCLLLSTLVQSRTKQMQRTRR